MIEFFNNNIKPSVDKLNYLQNKKIINVTYIKNISFVTITYIDNDGVMYNCTHHGATMKEIAVDDAKTEHRLICDKCNNQYIQGIWK